jgi:hypothetical protein
LVQKKIFQKETKLTDADLNEQIDISKHAREFMMSALGGSEDVRFGDGFKVIEHPTDTTNQVRVKAGRAAVHLNSGRAIVIQLGSDQDMSGFTTPGSPRTDYIYLDLVENEIDSTEDEDLINPAVGAETAIDIRLSYSIEEAEGSIPDPASGHVHVVLAEINRPASTPGITSDIVINKLTDILGYREVLWTMSMFNNFMTAGGTSTVAETWDATEDNTFHLDGGSENSDYWFVRVPYVKHGGINKVELYCEVKEGSGTQNINVAFALFDKDGTELDNVISADTDFKAWGQFYTLEIDISGIAEGEYIEIAAGFHTRTLVSAFQAWMRRIVISAVR